MALTDWRGMPLSTDNARSLARYEDALTLFHGYFNDPLAAIDAALAEDPGFVMGHCLRAGMIAMATDKTLEPMLRQSVEAAEGLLRTANEREHGHVAAARAWLDGDWAPAVELWGRVAIDYPRDSLAIQLAHLGDFYLGQSTMLRDRIARVLPAWSPDVPGYGYILGMHAFGLEECGEYGRAEDAGRRALAVERRDPWAIHAVAHVMEMQGRLAEGVRWLGEREADWAHDNGFAFHNWWHLALYHLDLGDSERVLALYDTAIRPKPSAVVLESIDAAALLWRLSLRGVDVGARWEELADTWEPTVEHGFYAFNDMHAMMALVGAGRDEAAASLLARVARAAAGSGTNAMMAREVGLPACRALAAFGRGDYAAAIADLVAIRPIAQRFGGSHAQRDVIALTLAEAALRAGEGALARAVMAERIAAKPVNPFGWRATARALDLLGRGVEAEQARARAADADREQRGARAA
jgi:tetratricopeptide (TPR) repeat protein